VTNSNEILTISVAEDKSHTSDSILMEPTACEHRVWVTPRAYTRAQLALKNAPEGTKLAYMCADCATDRGFPAHLFHHNHN
jgi:hypothetical protein